MSSYGKEFTQKSHAIVFIMNLKRFGRDKGRREGTAMMMVMILG